MFSGIHVYASCDRMPWANDEPSRNASVISQRPCKPSSRADAASPLTATVGLDDGGLQPPTSRQLVALAHTLDPNTLPSPQMLKMAGKTKWKVSILLELIFIIMYQIVK